MLGKVVIGRLFDYADEFLATHADEIAAYGVDAARQFLAILRAKILGEAPQFSTTDPLQAQFVLGVDEIIAAGEETPAE